MINGAAVDMDVVAVVGRHSPSAKTVRVWAALAAIKTNCQSRYTNVLKQEIYIEELLLDALFSVSQKAVIKFLRTKPKDISFSKSGQAEFNSFF